MNLEGDHIDQNSFRIVNYTSKKNVFILQLGKNDACDPKNQNKIILKKDLEAHMVFSAEKGETLICELFRRKGDYLSFINTYVYLWNTFN